jgi:hypothetical protein
MAAALAALSLDRFDVRFQKRPSDWAEIALKLADREDPLSQPGVEQKFNTLRRKILELGEEAETARRVTGSQKE